ncbi:type IV toxin-antitoxin system AbiEi family antitoxin domain-containing protein [Actinoplanes siamensis]|nr:type IV toxin-antitoxin system AbiEi family antitoxin domain-containing protein [Actinoplanes siamensis]
MPQLDEIARRQRGVVSRRQAFQAGISPGVLQRRVTTGRWQRLLPGTYATFAGRPPPAALRWAAVLYSGSGAMLCHRSAAEESGLVRSGQGAVHVLIPESRRVRPAPGMVVHRSRYAKARRHPRRRPPQTRLEETVLDLASTSASVDEALRWIIVACLHRRTTPDGIARALERRTWLPRRRAVAALLAYAAGRTTELPHWPTT